MAEPGALLSGPPAAVDAPPPADTPPADTPPADTPPADTPPAVPWTHQLANADLHANPALTRYNDLDAFVTGHLELDKSQGGKVSYPGEEATSEDWQAFYKAVPGFPETSAGYNVAAPEMPESVRMTDQEMNSALDGFHALGLTSAQVQGTLGLLANANTMRFQGQQADDQTHIDTAYDDLSKLPGWGPHTDRNLAIANEGLRREFGDNQAWLNTLVRVGEDGKVQPLRNIPQFIQMAHQFGMMKGHGRFVPGGVNAQSGEAAKAAISQAHTDRRAGKISDQQLNEVISQHGPLAYADDTDDVSYVRGGASSGAPKP